MALSTEDIKFPDWLVHGVDRVSNSEEWRVFIEQFSSSLQQMLNENGIARFQDLRPAERQFFVDKTLREMTNSTAHLNLFSKIQSILDHTLNERVRLEMGRMELSELKADLLYAQMEEGAMSLLRKWPEFKSKAYIFLNQRLPWSLRGLLWRLNLHDARVLDRYQRMIEAYPEQAVSAQDLEISERCEQLIGGGEPPNSDRPPDEPPKLDDGDPTLVPLRGSVGLFYGMKAVLSYYHAQTKKKNVPLSDTDYLLIVPLLYALYQLFPRKEPASRKVIELLVEEYFTLMSRRHPLMLEELSDDDQHRLVRFSLEVVRYMERIDRGVTQEVLRHLQGRSGGGGKNVSEQAMDNAQQLAPLVRLLLRTMFVTFVNLDTLLYIFDHYLIATDAPDFQEQFMQIAIAAYIVLVCSQSGGPGRDAQAPASAGTGGSRGASGRPNRSVDPNNPQPPPPNSGSARGTPTANRASSRQQQQPPSAGPAGSSRTGAGQPQQPQPAGKAPSETTRANDRGGSGASQYRGPSGTLSGDASSIAAPTTSQEQLVELFRIHGPKMRARDFQFIINKDFYGELFITLTKRQVASLDPRAAFRTSWSQWFTPAMPHRVYPEDRELDRLHHDEERRKLENLENELDLERKLRQDGDRKLKEAAHDHLVALTDAREQYAAEKTALVAEGAADREEHFRRERILREEISRLEDELEKLRGLLAANPPPPPQAHPLWEERPPVDDVEGPVVDDLDAAVFEFTKFFTDAIDKVVHGEGNDRHTLDENTRKFLTQHADDMRLTESQQFGRYLAPRELEDMPEGERQKFAEKLASNVEQRLALEYGISRPLPL